MRRNRGVEHMAARIRHHVSSQRGHRDTLRGCKTGSISGLEISMLQAILNDCITCYCSHIAMRVPVCASRHSKPPAWRSRPSCGPEHETPPSMWGDKMSLFHQAMVMMQHGQNTHVRRQDPVQKCVEYISFSILVRLLYIFKSSSTVFLTQVIHSFTHCQSLVRLPSYYSLTIKMFTFLSLCVLLAQLLTFSNAAAIEVNALDKRQSSNARGTFYVSPFPPPISSQS